MFLNNYHYIIYWHYYFNVFSVIYTCVLFISLLQTVNGVQYWRITFLLLLFVAVLAAAATDIIPVAIIKKLSTKNGHFLEKKKV